jgi:hypothetical protein
LKFEHFAGPNGIKSSESERKRGLGKRRRVRTRRGWLGTALEKRRQETAQRKTLLCLLRQPLIPIQKMQEQHTYTTRDRPLHLRLRLPLYYR